MSKEVMWGHVTHFWNYGTPNISGTVKAKNFKFGTYMDGSENYRKNAKLGPTASCGGQVTHFFWNFGTP